MDVVCPVCQIVLLIVWWNTSFCAINFWIYSHLTHYLLQRNLNLFDVTRLVLNYVHLMLSDQLYTLIFFKNQAYLQQLQLAAEIS